MSILRLQHTRSDGEVDTYHLKSVRRYTIGRGSSCEVRILDMKMSRQHAAIERQGSEWLLHDLGSTNGARVDGVRIQGSFILEPGHEIRVGSSDLTVASIHNNGNDQNVEDITPVRQEALPATESQDEHPQWGKTETDIDPNEEPADEEPADDVGSSVSGPLTPKDLPSKNDYGTEETSTTGSNEFDFSDIPESSTKHALQALPSSDSEPVLTEPEPELAESGLKLESEPELALDEPEPVSVEPAAVEPVSEAVVEAVSKGPQRTKSGRVKPITIRSGKTPPEAANTAASAAVADAPPALSSSGPQRTKSGRIKPITIRTGNTDRIEKPAQKPAAQVAPPAPQPVQSAPQPELKPKNVEPATAPKPPSDESRMFIKVLGRRVGPLTRGEARSLKARELKGTLTEADLDDYPLQ